MIRVFKRDIPPPELAKRGYEADSVKAALLSDQRDKCYLCEREVGTDYEVEHLKSRHHHPELENSWTNLFLACSYCNGKKSSSCDELIDPALLNVEDEIEQRFDSTTGRFVFIAVNADSVAVRCAVGLLSRLFNGVRPGMPTLKDRGLGTSSLTPTMRFQQKSTISWNKEVQRRGIR